MSPRPPSSPTDEQRARRRAPLICLLAALAALALALTGCGGDEEGGGEGMSAAEEGQVQAPPSEPTEPEVVPTPSLASLDVGEDTSEKPEFEPPQGSPPQDLQTYDVVEGDGAEATAGRPLTMQYVGKSFSSGQEFDASWDRGEPFSFTLAAGEVIPGWDLGIEGMREGGRRVLVIPPGLAYGEQGSPPTIGPGETLVFVVDLEKVGQ